MSIVVDYAWPPHPSVADLRAVGATGVVRYLAPSWTGKAITAGEYQTLRAAGIDVSLVWELDARDWLAGAGTGWEHALEAVAQARSVGHPAGAGIYGAADWDMVRAEWIRGASGYAGAFAAAVRAGGYRVGVYGPADVLTWCRDEHGYELFWQAGMSTAWSGGRNAAVWPGAHLRQRRTQTIGGADCDVNDVLAADWGAGPAPASQRAREADMAVFHNGLPTGRTYIAVVGPKVFTSWTQIKPLIDAGLPQYQMAAAPFQELYEALTEPPAPQATLTLTQEQADAIGAAAAGQAAAVIGDRLEVVEQALGAAGAELAALGTTQP